MAGSNQTPPRQFPGVLPRQVQPCHRTRHANREITVVMDLGIVLPVDEKHRRRRPGGSDFAEVVCDRFADGGAIDHEPAAADVPCRGVHDCQRKRGGDRRVDSGSTVFEDPAPICEAIWFCEATMPPRARVGTELAPTVTAATRQATDATAHRRDTRFIVTLLVSSRLDFDFRVVPD